MNCPRCNRPNPVQHTEGVLWCWNCEHEWPGTLPEHVRETEPAPVQVHYLDLQGKRAHCMDGSTLVLQEVDANGSPIGDEHTVAFGSGTHPPTWAWVEREAGKRFAAAVGTGMGRALTACRDMTPGPDISDLEGELAFAEVWAFARLWRWLGAE